MSQDTIWQVYRALKNGEPQTPNEIASIIGLDQKTVQMALMELANTRQDVRWKKVGRYRLFWRKRRK